MAQRLKQGNMGASLPLTAEDFLFARGTPLSVGGIMRCVCVRIAKNGFAERSIHDIRPRSSSFWHYHTEMSSKCLDQLAAALDAARLALLSVKIDEDPNGIYKRIDYWRDQQPLALRMKYVSGIAEHDVPTFEAVWAQIAAQFPNEPVLA